MLDIGGSVRQETETALHDVLLKKQPAGAIPAGCIIDDLLSDDMACYRIFISYSASLSGAAGYWPGSIGSSDGMISMLPSASSMISP